ncbi:MAG: patatin-like phospholipase family protein [Pseudomonadota bacterium]|nr:patatin-like phospholipase family protein [Pseudomonadota bacterium]
MSGDNKSVSLVLGSGGARGLAHIGVIHWLEENGYEIKSISGCSMGALIGGIYAAGKLDTFEHWVRSITKLEIVALLDLSWGKSGLVKGDKIINTLVDLVGDQKIEDLPVRFTAVAADISAEKEIWINSGRLFDAIRASMSLPLFFTPFDYRGTLLIDGGVLNPVPIAPTFGDNTDLTIAVNLGGPPAVIDDQAGIRENPQEQDSFIQQNINRFIKSLQQSAKSADRKDWDVYDVAMQAFETMQSTIARQKLAAYPPDLTIEIARNACRTLEFDRADEMIKLGYSKTKQLMS